MPRVALISRLPSPVARPCRVAAVAIVLCGVLLAVQARAAEGGSRAAASSARAIRIALRSRVEVGPGAVLLGDVADVSGPDVASVRLLEKLSLGPAPRAGRPVRVDRGELMRWIRARTAIDARWIAWSGSEVSELFRTVGHLAAENLVASAERSAREQLSARGLRVDIRSGSAPPDVEVPAGLLELKVRPLSEEAALARRLSPWVDVWVDGRFFRTVQVSLDVGVFGPAFVAKESRLSGSLLEPSDVEVREVEWSGRAAPPIRAARLERFRLRRLLAAGEPLTTAHVEAAPLVARGESAIAHASQGRVRLEGQVEVLEDGFSGQTVTVKRPGASKAMVARVTGLGTVEVLP